MIEDVMFADENFAEKSNNETWKVMVVDDEKDVHEITEVILKGIEFEGKRIETISAYSGKEARELAALHPDTALILLDVVMDTDHEGLDVVKYIREVLGNKTTRIILRTGQPGQAPEKEVVVSYDINDYKEKSELTAQKLYVAIVTALRSYKDLRIIEKREEDLKKTHENLKKAKELAEQESKIKSLFLGNVSHEMRTPINGIIGMTELIKFTELNKRQEEYINLIIIAADRLLKIIRDMIDVANIDTGNVKLFEETILVEEFVKTILEPHIQRASEKNLEFNYLIDSNIPDSIVGDKVKTERIIEQLTDNAVKFTDSGKIDFEIKAVEKDEKEVKILFSVKDTGIGIEREKIDDIFNVFVQGDDSMSKRYHGMGLGLSLAKKLVHLMGGEISVESTYGSGSCFSFWLKFRYQR